MWYCRVNRKTVIILAAIVCVLAVAIVTVIHAGAVQEGKLKLSLNGDSRILLAPGQAYEELGAQATFEDEDAVTQVTVERSGSVDPAVQGVYFIKYKATYGDAVTTAYRAVRVADVVAPQIVLTEDPDAYTLPGHPYAEEGFTATDDLDGDITHLVRRSEHDGVVTYAVSDRAGNQTVAHRQIHYKDPVPPQISLHGSMLVAVNLGSNYAEPGYYATDNLEGDVTDRVSVSGQVDVQKPGAYTLKYTVKDLHGNQAVAERIVCVFDQNDPNAVAPNGKVIYLTFDDGPGPHTDRLLDVLAKYNVKATFFLVNTAFIGTAERIAKEGHTVAIHTATHRYQQVYANDEAYFQDLYTMQDIIEKHTGQKSMILRFPGGTSNTISKQYNKGLMTRLVQKVTEQGFRYFDWNVDSKDAGGAKTPEEVLANVIAGVGEKTNSVVLQHDLFDYSVDAVEQILIWGLSNGYTFAPLTEGSPACQHDPNN